MERSLPRTQSIHLRFGKGSQFTDQIVQLYCSQTSAPRPLFRIVTKPWTASNCSLFVVIFPGIFLISELFGSKSLGTETSINNAFFSFLYLTTLLGCSALFIMFTLNGIIRLYASIMFLFSIIAFGLRFHEFWGAGILKFLQMFRCITPHTLLCLCVYSWSDMSFLHLDRRSFVLAVCTLQNLHLSDWLSPANF